MIRFRRSRREVPLLNTTSTADISFMLLIFFLVTTSMGLDKGLARQMPPKSEQQEQQATPVDRQHTLEVVLTADGKLTIDGDAASPKLLEERLAALVARYGANHLVAITMSRESPYDAYFHVQQTLQRTYATLRDQASRKRYGTPYATLTPDQRSIVDEMVPRRVSETVAKATGEQEEAQ